MFQLLRISFIKIYHIKIYHMKIYHIKKSRHIEFHQVVKELNPDPLAFILGSEGLNLIHSYFVLLFPSQTLYAHP